MSSTFVPEMEDMGGITPTLWRYTPILPLVFGMELSYMEQVAKLTQKVNEVINSDNAQASNIEKLYQAFAELEAAALGKGEGWISTAMLADGAVTGDKIASLAVGFNQLARGSVKGDRIATKSIESHHINDRVIGANHIKDGNVVNEKIADGAITEDKIGTGAVTGDKIASRSVGFNQLASGSVKGDRIATKSIESYHINDRVIAAEHIMDGNVINQKIADGAITLSKFTKPMVEAWNLVVQTVDELLREQGTFSFQQIRISHGLQIAPNALISLGGSVAQYAGDPVGPQDVANKRYVDGTVNDRLSPYILMAPLDAEHEGLYQSQTSYGDGAMRAILEGRPIYIRVPDNNIRSNTNYDGEPYTYLYSPVLTYHLPNHENDYLYLYYLRDEKNEVDLSAPGKGTISIPVYAQLKLKLSTSYDRCPLGYINPSIYKSTIANL